MFLIVASHIVPAAPLLPLELQISYLKLKTETHSNLP